MKLNKIITVLFLSGACFLGQHTAVAHAANADTVISNELTATKDMQRIDGTEEVVVVSGTAVSCEAAGEDVILASTDNVVQVAGSVFVAAEMPAMVPETGAEMAEIKTAASNEVIVNENTTKNKKTSIVVQNKKSTKKVSNKKAYTKADLKLMSCIIYCEASGEPYAGKLAVGIVVMNRKSSKSFPNTVKGVIYQKYQFGPVRNGSLSKALKRYESGRFNSAAEKACVKAAKSALTGNKKVTYGSKKYNMASFHFFSTQIVRPRLIIKHHQFK